MDQLLIALDVDSADRAAALADELRDAAGGFKIGNRLFTTAGPTIVRRLIEDGHRVFLDLKYHDIPSVVAGAVRAATDLGVWMLTVHTSGGLEMLRAAKAAAGEPGGPLIVGVTVLTSFGDAALQGIGVTRDILTQVDALATLAQDAGIDGVVASPLEVAHLRAACGPDFTLVTPGIRSSTSGAGSDDQTRTLGPADAIRAGSSYLVVGRPIIAAPDPRAAALQIAGQIAGASSA